MFHLSMSPGTFMLHAGIVAFVGAVVLAVLFAGWGAHLRRDSFRLVFLCSLSLSPPPAAYVAVGTSPKQRAAMLMDVPWEEISEAYVADWSASEIGYAEDERFPMRDTASDGSPRSGRRALIVAEGMTRSLPGDG